MKSQLIGTLLTASMIFGTHSTSTAQEVTCGNLTESKKNGCTVENASYYAVLNKGLCSVRSVLNPSTGKNEPTKALDVNYQVFMKYNEGSNRGMKHFRYVPFSVYGDPMKSSCEGLMKYAGLQVFGFIK